MRGWVTKAPTQEDEQPDEQAQEPPVVAEEEWWHCGHVAVDKDGKEISYWPDFPGWKKKG
ncbi:MAG: hypothetical protein WKF65_04860 [Gaiellaceae bacterium]